MRHSCLNDQSIKISYFDPLSSFDSVQSEIHQILPLKDLHWKPQGDIPVVTVKSLNVEFLPETSFAESKTLNDVPFIKYIVVKCTSIDEYRSKIRPLIRQWVSTQTEENDKEDGTDGQEHFFKGILLLGSDIQDSKLFKTVSLPEKIEKDFPTLPLYQLHTVYKSQNDRADHWNKYSSSLKKIILEVFEKRVTDLEEANSKSPTFETHQQLLKLYLNFKIYGKANLHMKKIEVLLASSVKPLGELALPVIDSRAASKAAWSSFTVFGSLRYQLFNRVSVIECLYPNILADKIKELYRVIIIDFLYALQIHFQSSKALHQVIYHACNEILNLKLLPALPLKDGQSNYSLWKEMYGDILQIKRESWIELANCHQSNITFCASPVVTLWTIDDEIKSTIESPEIAFQQFVRLTSELIELFKETRGRAVDLLSIEIANVFYQMKSFEKTMTLLQSSHEYYRSAGWNLIASDILVKYVTCLEMLDARTITIEGEDVPTISVLANSYLNLVTIPQARDKITWWNKFLTLNENAQLVYSLDLLMTTEIDEKVLLSASNTYSVNLTILDMKVMTDVSVSSLKLLTKKTGKDQFVVFQKNHLELAPQSEMELVLETTNIAYGEFELISLELVIGNTVFSKEYDDYKKISIQPLYSADNFQVELKEPSERNLELNEIELETVKAEKVENFECSIEILEPLSVVFAETNTKSITVNSSNFKRAVQYICKEEQSLELHLLQTLNFKREGVLYSEKKNVKIDHQVELSIAVDDIYKSGAFYFNFTISAKYEPLHIVATTLCCNTEPKHEITGGYDACDASCFLELPEAENLQSFFHIRPSKNAFSYKDSFSLSVSYASLSGIVNDFLTQKFFGKNSKFFQLKHIWETLLLPHFEYHKSQFFDYNTIKISNYDRPQFEKQLQQIFSDRASIDFLLSLYETLFDGLEVEEDFDFPERRARTLKKLSLSLAIPPPINNVVFSVEMSLDEMFSGKTLIIGQPYSCTLKICKQFKAWGGLKLEDDSSVYECELDKGAGSEEWLINGLKKFSITGNVTTLNVTMIPIKRGYLRFPNVSISLAENLNSASANASTVSLNHTVESSKIETDFVNINDNIIVV